MGRDRQGQEGLEAKNREVTRTRRVGKKQKRMERVVKSEETGRFGKKLKFTGGVKKTRKRT